MNTNGSEFRYNSHYPHIFISKGQTDACIEAFSIIVFSKVKLCQRWILGLFRVSSYLRYYLDGGSSVTQWTCLVSGNLDNNFIRLISASEHLLQPYLREQTLFRRLIEISVCVIGTSATLLVEFYGRFCTFDLVGLFLNLLGRILGTWLPCVDY